MNVKTGSSTARSMLLLVKQANVASLLEMEVQIAGWDRSAAHEDRNGFPALVGRQDSTTLSMGKVPFALQIDDPWFRKVSLSDASRMIFEMTTGMQPMFPGMPQGSSVRVEWPATVEFLDLTWNDKLNASGRLDEQTAEFVDDLGVRDGVAWMRSAVGEFFPGADFEIEALPGDEGEQAMLALRIYGSFSSFDFRERRHAFCEGMLLLGHTVLHQVTSVFQRRTEASGRPTLSWYSSVSADWR